jgi:hypothetical protein
MIIPSTVDNPIKKKGDLMGFERCDFLGELSIGYANQTIMRYGYYHCVHFSETRRTDAGKA